MTGKEIGSVGLLVVIILIVCVIVALLGFYYTGPLKMEVKIWLPERYSIINAMPTDEKYEKVPMNEMKQYNDLSIWRSCNGLAYIKVQKEKRLRTVISYPFTTVTPEFPRRYLHSNIMRTSANWGIIELEYERNWDFSLIFGIIVPAIMMIVLILILVHVLKKPEEAE